MIDPKTPVAVLADFGLSTKIDSSFPLLTTRCGSEDYVPPELLIGNPYDGRQSDVWSLGVLLYAIMEARLPFDPNGDSPKRVPYRIVKYDWSWKAHKTTKKDWQWAKYTVERCLVPCEKRISSSEIPEMTWLNLQHA